MKRLDNSISPDGNVLTLHDIHLERGAKVILDGLSWRVSRGQHWAVVGPNGSGKTTMLKVATGAMWPSSGEVWGLGAKYGRVDLRELRKRIGWVSSALDEWMLSSEPAIDVVVSGYYATFGIYDKPTEDDRLRASGLLEFLDCGAIAQTRYDVLSQGEKQKVLIARALMAKAELLILDEAAAGLDLSAREVLLTSIEYIACQENAPTLVFVTHHIEEIMPSITHVLVLRGGKVLAAGPKADILTGPVLTAAFGLPIEVDARHGRFWARVTAHPPQTPK